MTPPPITRADDRSEEHLSWLVENRSRNQRATLNLFLVIEGHRQRIDDNVRYTAIAQHLAGIAFSLWRAVFLSDFGDDGSEQLSDAAKFLGTLIAHNAIAYPQDRIARGWSFPYYLDNARYRLKDLADTEPLLFTQDDIEQTTITAKGDWSNAQTMLEKAIDRFGTLLIDG